MSPKQRNPFLFRNNSAKVTAARQRQQRVSNLERAEVPVSNLIITNEIKRPRKPFNPMIPISAPAGSVASNIYYVSYEGYLYNFTETALTLITAPAIETVFARSIKTYNGDFYFAGYDYNGVGDSGLILYRSVAGAPANRVSKPTSSAVLVHFDIAADGRIWAFWNDGSPSRVYYSDDQGDSWTLSTTFANDGQVDLTRIVCHSTNPDLIATTFLNSLSEIELTSTINRGSSWNSVVINGIAGYKTPILPVYHVYYAEDKIITIYVGNSGPQKLYSVNSESDLSGLNQTIIEEDVTQQWGSTINQDDPDVIVAVAADGSSVKSFYLSTDRGLSYNASPYPLSNYPYGMVFSNNVLYFAINEGPVTSFYKIQDVRTSMEMELLFTESDGHASPEAASDNFVNA